MLVAPSPVEAIPLMSPPAATDRSPAAGTPRPAAAPPASAVPAPRGTSRLAHQVPAAPTAPTVTVANAAAIAQRSDVACGIHDQEANRNSHRHPPNTATVAVTATSHRINRIALPLTLNSLRARSKPLTAATLVRTLRRRRIPTSSGPLDCVHKPGPNTAEEVVPLSDESHSQGRPNRQERKIPPGSLSDDQEQMTEM